MSGVERSCPICHAPLTFEPAPLSGASRDWEESKLAAASERLTLTIRTTLPQEAKLDD